MRPAHTFSHAAVIGLGLSGMAAVRLLKRQGFRVTGMDEKYTSLSEAPKHCDQVQDHLDAAMLLETDLIVLSPGVDPRRPELEPARQKGIPIIGEMALGLRHLTLPCIAVTGTNGKSTVTELIAAMLRASGKRVFAGGNLGTPLCDFILNPEDAEMVVLEVSSYQLDTLESFQPDVAVLLNISEDHLDRYPDMEAYARSKARLFKDMRAGLAVLNHRDRKVRAIGQTLSIPVLWYDRETGGLCIAENQLRLEDGHLFLLEDFSLPGRHNRENLSAALLAARAMGATDQGIRNTIAHFKGLEHRMTFCGNVCGVACYDDSKATNIDAVCRALTAFNRKVVLIMGGRDKGGDYALMADTVSQYARKIILIGEAAQAIESAFGKKIPCERASSLAEAVEKAVKAADPDTPVLLSPACSSFDMFANYKDRGLQFRNLVAALSASGGIS